MPEPQPLLLALFQNLRKENLLLGIDDYLEAVEALRSGYGLYDLEEMRFILRLLWVKSPKELAIFDEAFNLLIVPDLTPPKPIIPAAQTSATAAQSTDMATPTTGAEAKGLENRLSSKDEPSELEPSPGETDEDEEDVGDFRITQRVAVPMIPGRMGQPRPTPEASGAYQFTIPLPMPPREMAGIWRHLRQLKQEGPAVELDVQGTIERISRDGFLINPVMQAQRRNQARLLVLVDCHDTMQPFRAITGALVDSIRAGGLLRQMVVFYYSHLPDTQASRHLNLTDPLPIREVLARHADGGSVLIISDAGAAPGFSSARPVERVQRFLEWVRSYTYRYSWLNPFPRERWAGTSAGKIARLAPMFPFDRDGLVDTVNILRGHPFPIGIDLGNRS